MTIKEQQIIDNLFKVVQDLRSENQKFREDVKLQVETINGKTEKKHLPIYLEQDILKAAQQAINESDIEQWMCGECIPFCVALNEIFPQYQIAVINDEFEDVDEDAEYDFNFVHAFCYYPNNHNIIIDARGVRKLKDLYEDFYDINPIIDWDIPNAKYLIGNYAGKEFASEESFEYDISEYQSAKEYISKNIQKYSVNLK